MSSPIPSDKEGLVPDRLVSNETVSRRAAQATNAARVTARTGVKTLEKTGQVGRAATQKTVAATRQTAKNTHAQIQQRRTQPALGHAQKQELRARELDKKMLAGRNRTATQQQQQQQQVQQRGRER